MRVNFHDFWPGFDYHSNFFVEFLKTITRKLEVVSPHKKADLEFYSAFTSSAARHRHLFKAMLYAEKGFGFISQDDFISRTTYGYRSMEAKRGIKRVWFTGENRFPPSNIFDLTLSFEATSRVDRNLYFPIWMYRLNWGLGYSLSEISPRPRDLIQFRKVDFRSPSLVTFSSNRDPFRLAFIERISSKLPVTTFGRGFSNAVTSKLEASKNYLFQFCPENDIYPGYITEKLIEAWACECVPIWRGGMTDSRFNTRAFIDVTGLTITEAIEKVLSYSTKELHEMRQQPLMHVSPSLSDLRLYFEELITND